MAEEWRDIPGWEGAYQASSLGRIRSLPHTRMKLNRGVTRAHLYRGRTLSPGEKGSTGYRHVTLMRDGKKCIRFVHFLVCSAFHGPCPAGRQAAHNDGDNTNNTPDNLRWATTGENQADKELHGQVVRGERVGTAVLTDDAVRKIRRRRKAGASLADLASDFSVSKTTIARVCSRETWAHIV